MYFVVSPQVYVSQVDSFVLQTSTYIHKCCRKTVTSHPALGIGQRSFDAGETSSFLVVSDDAPWNNGLLYMFTGTAER